MYQLIILSPHQPINLNQPANSIHRTSNSSIDQLINPWTQQPINPLTHQSIALLCSGSMVLWFYVFLCLEYVHVSGGAWAFSPGPPGLVTSKWLPCCMEFVGGFLEVHVWKHGYTTFLLLLREQSCARINTFDSNLRGPSQEVENIKYIRNSRTPKAALSIYTSHSPWSLAMVEINSQRSNPVGWRRYSQVARIELGVQWSHEHTEDGSN